MTPDDDIIRLAGVSWTVSPTGPHCECPTSEKALDSRLLRSQGPIYRQLAAAAERSEKWAAAEDAVLWSIADLRKTVSERCEHRGSPSAV